MFNKLFFLTLLLTTLSCASFEQDARVERDRSCMSRCVANTAAALKGGFESLPFEQTKLTFLMCRNTCSISMDDPR